MNNDYEVLQCPPDYAPLKDTPTQFIFLRGGAALMTYEKACLCETAFCRMPTVLEAQSLRLPVSCWTSSLSSTFDGKAWVSSYGVASLVDVNELKPVCLVRSPSDFKRKTPVSFPEVRCFQHLGVLPDWHVNYYLNEVTRDSVAAEPQAADDATEICYTGGKFYDRPLL